MTLSPLAPDRFPDLPVIKGVRFAAVSAEVKYKDRDDVMVAVMAPETAIAGVFTKSATRSAPVLDCQAKLGGEIFAPAVFLVNSGNSNAFTGSAGERSVEEICASAAAVFDVPETRIFTASTGVIGERLPHGQIINKISDF